MAPYPLTETVENEGNAPDVPVAKRGPPRRASDKGEVSMPHVMVDMDAASPRYLYLTPPNEVQDLGGKESP